MGAQAKARLSRAEQKTRTRADLLRAARDVFERRGFHGATLEEIADAAGYSKGAVYSNFKGKDELFLAVFDEHLERRLETYRDELLAEADVDESYRLVARIIAAADERNPRWQPLLLEFWAHAARRPPVRKALLERRERFLDAIAQLIDELAARHGVAYRLPSKQVARGSGALLRGVGAERLLDPDAISRAEFEEMHAAYMQGLTVPAAPRRGRDDGDHEPERRGGARRAPARARR